MFRSSDVYVIDRLLYYKPLCSLKIHLIILNALNEYVYIFRSRNCVAFPKTKGTGIDALLPQLTRQTRGVLELMIEYDADKRVNIRRLLKNTYFDDIR